MGDHFVLLVDRLLTESTLEAAIESRNLAKDSAFVSIDDADIDYSPCKDSEMSSSPRKLVECRICQDEGFDSNMETPCACCGSLKYAHRRCVQKWCNEKGDTVCEICHEEFKPGYTAPPPIFRLGRLPVNFRGNWPIARRDLNNPRLISVVNQNFADPDYDEHSDSMSRSIICCRSVAIIFMILLILRHTLPMMFARAGNYSFPLILLLLLRVAGIVLPICIIIKAVTSMIHRHYQQTALPVPSDEETGASTLHQSVTPAE